MVDRYTRPEMGRLWSVEARFENMLKVEKAVARMQSQHGLIPAEASEAINEKGRFELHRILEIEKETRHDVIAFVSAVAENVGDHGRYIHYGLTSSDVLDTATSVQMQGASKILMASLDRLLQQLLEKAKTHQNTLCSGRTHGMHAEPTSFGYKLMGHYHELLRNKERLSTAFEQVFVGKLSGAVGTYSFLNQEIEADVCKELNLTQETVATQVIPRDRHGELLTAFALTGGAIERLSVEIRHLQRTEMGEAFEGFAPGQKGSSAMPHKKNPIGSENLTGCARLLRSYAAAALENIALWHERDISHSSVERVALPDSFILLDYALDRMATIIERLQVNEERMKQNMDLSQGQLFSSHLLLHIVDGGLSREEAYKVVQSLSHGLKPGEHLKQACLNSQEVLSRVSKETIEDLFSGKSHLASIKKRLDQLLQESH